MEVPALELERTGQDNEVNCDEMMPRSDANVLTGASRGSDVPIGDVLEVNLVEAKEEVLVEPEQDQVGHPDGRGMPYPVLVKPFVRYDPQLLHVDLTVGLMLVSKVI